METIVRDPATGRTERIVETSNDTAGWAVAVIVLLVVLAVGAFLWMRYYSAPAAAPADNSTPGSAQINVTLPSDDTNNSGASGDTSDAANPSAQ